MYQYRSNQDLLFDAFENPMISVLLGHRRVGNQHGLNIIKINISIDAGQCLIWIVKKSVLELLRKN